MRERTRVREQWEKWKTELLADEDWRASAVRQSEQRAINGDFRN